MEAVEHFEGEERLFGEKAGYTGVKEAIREYIQAILKAAMREKRLAIQDQHSYILKLKEIRRNLIRETS